MNKIFVDSENYSLEVIEDTYLIIDKNTNLDIKLRDNNKKKLIILIKNSIVKINIDLCDNSYLIVNSLGIDSSINYELSLHNNSSIEVVDSILSKIDSINNINICHNGNNSKTNFWTNGVNLDNNKMFFNINGIIKRDCLNNYLDENSKIINLKNGDSKIVPNLIIDTKEVIANHEAFIGTWTNDDLYYLMSRGISKKDVENLLIKSLLLSNMEDDNDDFIKEIYNNLNGGD